ncbi:MAG: S8 family serine peptidase [bacterium]|nr:S8 family serine peptidase [bacterium]
MTKNNKHNYKKSMKISQVEVKTKTSISEKIGVLLIMFAALSLAAGLIAGMVLKIESKEPQAVSTSSINPFTTLKKPIQYAKDEIIVKFVPTVGDEIGQVFKEGNKLSIITSTDNLDNLNVKYNVDSIERVFKGLENKAKAQGQEFITTQEEKLELDNKFPERTARVSQNTTLPDLENSYIIKLKEEAEITQVIADYQKDPDVVYAEPNYIYTMEINIKDNQVKEIVADTPEPNIVNDPYYYSQGSWGQDYDDLWGIKKIESERAWDISQGEGVVVAVIDTGIDYNHEDIQTNIWTNENEIPDNGIDDDNNGFIDDVRGYDFTTCEQFGFGFCVTPKPRDNDPMDGNGHGTHTSGTIAGVGNNGVGVIGVAPKSKIMPVQGLNPQGAGYTTDLVDAIYYAVNTGADILSNSWGGPVSQLVNDAFGYAWAHGVVSVAAAGNANADVSNFSPANIPTVISVAATTQDDIKASFSNYGDITLYKDGVDVTAPGGDNVGQSWVKQNNNEAFGGTYKSSSLIGAYSGNMFDSMFGPVNYTLFTAKGPDRGIINIYYYYEMGTFGQWEFLTSIDNYSTNFHFASEAFTIPESFMDHHGWLKFEISNEKNPQSSNYYIDIDGGESEFGQFDDDEFVYFDSDADVSLSRNILSLRALDTDMYGDGSHIVGQNYYRASGTSMAAPHVAGVAALLLSQNPRISSSEIGGRIYNSADNIDELNPDWQGKLGAGRVNAYQALVAEPQPVIKVTDVRADSILEVGEESNVIISLINKGIPTKAVTAVLSSPSLFVSVVSSKSQIDDLDWSARGTNEDNPFIIFIHEPQPGPIPFNLHIETAEGYQEDYNIKLNIISKSLKWISTIEGVNSQHGPIVEDLNNDGYNEIVVELTGMNQTDRGQGAVAVLNSNGEMMPGWPIDPNPQQSQILTAIAVGDIDNDGLKDVVVAGEAMSDGITPMGVEIYAYNYNGNLLSNFPVFIEDGSSGFVSMSLVDLDQDNHLDIVINNNYYATAYNYQGELVSGWPVQVPSQGEAGSQPAVGDLDNDGEDEVGFLSAHNINPQGHALNGDGTYVSGWPISTTGALCEAPTSLGDLDDDGILELLNANCRAGSNYGLNIYRSSGEQMLNISKPYPNTYIGQVGVPVDLDKDGDLEIVIPTHIWEDGTVDAWHHDGTPVDGWPVERPGNIGRGTSSVVAGDIDGDGYQEILLGTYTNDNKSYINAWNHDGSVVQGFPMELPASTFGLQNGNLVITDLDNNGLLDLVNIRSEDPNHFPPKTYVSVFELTARYNSANIHWPMFHHDPQHTGRAD